MSDAIQQLIRQTEIKKLQLELSLKFQENLTLFKQRFPALHDLVCDRQAKTIQLKLDQNDNINLYDVNKRAWFYANSPVDYAENQVNKTLANCQAERIRIQASRVNNPDHLHIPLTNELIEHFSDVENEAKRNPQRSLHTLILSGLGLGYQVPFFIDKCKITNLFIYESDIDVFHASLHCVDWKVVLDYFSTNNRSITFCIGVSPEKSLEQIEKAVNQRGLFHWLYNFISQHTTRVDESVFIDNFKKNVANYVGSLGFFDDEQIGLAHGLENLKHNPTFLKETKISAIDTPVLIVGNGPSLDLHEAYLKENKDKAIIMSCGTSLASLYKMGVKPHFHIEMERTMGVQDFLMYGTDEEYRKGITLLCLHTVSPNTIAMFEQSCMAIKPNDAAEFILKDLLKPQALITLAFCNPTVANCALAFSVNLGFRNIHLIGTDFGVGEKGQHHSKSSTHYVLEERAEDKENFKYNYKDNRNIVVEGNFGGKVKSHNTLNMARFSIQRYLQILRNKGVSISVTNSNMGAKIEGATPCKVEALPELETFDTHKLVTQIQNTLFHHVHTDDLALPETHTLLEYFFSIEQELKLDTTLTRESQLLDELVRVFTLVEAEKDKTTHLLLRGSLNAFFSIIAQHCTYTPNDSIFIDRYSYASAFYNRFIDKAYEKMRSSALELDQTRNELFSGLTYNK